MSLVPLRLGRLAVAGYHAVLRPALASRGRAARAGRATSSRTAASRHARAAQAGGHLAVRGRSARFPGGVRVARRRGLQRAPGRRSAASSTGSRTRAMSGTRTTRSAPCDLAGDDPVPGEDALDEPLRLMFGAGRRATEVAGDWSGFLTGWHDRERAWWGEGTGRVDTLLGLGICEQVGVFRGDGLAFHEWFAAARGPAQVVHVPDHALSSRARRSWPSNASAAGAEADAIWTTSRARSRRAGVAVGRRLDVRGLADVGAAALADDRAARRARRGRARRGRASRRGRAVAQRRIAPDLAAPDGSATR